MHRTKRNTLLASLALAGTWPLAAQTAAPAPAEPTPAASEADLVVLSPFEVTTSRNVGYTARDTLAGSRIRTEP